MYTKLSLEDIKRKLKETLDEERYLHSTGTAEKAAELAEQFGCDKEKAFIAGLLHDCAKCLSHEKNEKYSYLVADFEKESRKTWHAPIGAYIAKTEYAVDDEEILSAIRWHTVGKKNMTLFEKIIFLADKIEHKTREKEFRKPLEDALKTGHNLDAGMLQSFKMTVNSLVARNLPISFQTIEVYNDLICKLR